MTILAPERLAARAALLSDEPAPAAPPPTAQEIIAYVVEHHGSTDVAALTSLVLDRIPRDQGTLWRLLQQLVAGEIRRLLQGETATVPTAPVGPSPGRKVEGYHRPTPGRAGAATPTKWEVLANTANDPLRAMVQVGSRWVRWADLTAEDLRAMARRDEASATKLLARVVALDALASDLEAAGAKRLADLAGAAERIGGL